MIENISITNKNGYRAGCNCPADIVIRTEETCDQIRITEVDFSFGEETGERRTIEIEFFFPAIDIAGMWSPSCGMNRNILADWSPGVETMMSISAPIVCFYSHNSENVHTIALSEVRQKVTSFYGIREEDGNMICRIRMEIGKGMDQERYQMKIWESDRKEDYWNTIRKAVCFWESESTEKIPQVPEAARLPLYSFWYSYHQLVNAENIEKESRLAADMGFASIIVDDGWQTDDANRGYAWCGDWEPSKKKFPDFAGHVKKVQDMGIRYMIWFSVPFVGKNADCFLRFKDKLLAYDENASAGILDIRYPEVRKYLCDIYVRAVRDWGVDGLKLDFIDEFYLRPDSPAYTEGMDHADVQDALCSLLAEVNSKLRNIKPDILIEFRQRYVGPEIRKYGNILRVVDCPGSSLSNRVGIADLRLLSGSTAIHSDMLMWHPDETVENAALQVVSCLFATVQISVRLAELDERKRSMLEFWLKFMKEHETVLLEADLAPLQPQNLYPFIRAVSETEGEEVLVSYTENHYVNLDDRERCFYYVHAGGEGNVILEGDRHKTLSYTLYNCMGQMIQAGQVKAGALHKLEIPQAGLLCVTE